MQEKKERNVKIALVMRGTPGSGKSTFSNYLKNMCGAKVHEVDQFHVDLGKFSWDYERADDFYERNFENFKTSCQKSEQLIIADCMNLFHDEVEKYVSCARDMGYHVYVVTADILKPEIGAARNLHGVGLQKLIKMRESFENWPQLT